jgi:hypothetical protein
VQIFHHKEHGPLRGDAQQDRQQGLEGPLLVLLGRHQQGRIVGGQRQGEQGGKEGHGLCQRQAILHQKPLEFAELLRRGLLPLEAQRHPLQQINPRIQGAVLIIGRTLARRQPRLGLAGHLFFQHLDETRFADACLATQQHHLPASVLDLFPALAQQAHFLLPANEGSQAHAASRFQATAGHTLIQHPIDRQWLGEAFNKTCA